MRSLLIDDLAFKVTYFESGGGWRRRRQKCSPNVLKILEVVQYQKSFLYLRKKTDNSLMGMQIHLKTPKIEQILLKF